MVKWLQGKKTYIGAATIAIAVVAGFFLHALAADQLAIGLGSAISVAGLGAKLDRYLGPAATILQDVQAKNFKAAAREAASAAASASVAATKAGN